MKSAKERQRDYRERRKEQKEAGLIKLKILTSVSAGKKLEMLSEIDNADIGTILSQAVALLWSQRFGNVGVTEKKVAASKQAVAPKKEKRKKTEKKTKKVVKSESAKANKATKNKTETVPMMNL